MRVTDSLAIRDSAGYRNSKGNRTHHARKSTKPAHFVGVDGEGVDTPLGLHLYVLLGVGEVQHTNPNGMDWKEALEFLYSQYEKGMTYVGFFLGYDFTMMFRSLPESRAWMLFTSEGKAKRKHRIPGKAPHPVECDGWQFDLLGMKRLRIRPKLCQCANATCDCEHAPWMYVNDVGSFFQTSFLRVIDPKEWESGKAIVTPEEYAIVEEGKKRRDIAALDEDMLRYNRLENVLLARIMSELDRGFLDIGIHLTPSSWYGPGQAAQVWLTNEKVPTGKEIEAVVPKWFLEAARMAYYGGWFEIFMHGIIPGASYEYDINSAYPSIIRHLPCLLHGTYSYGDGIPTLEDNEIALVYARVWARNMPELPHKTSRWIGSMLHRDADGSISRPLATEGWFWMHELLAAEKAGLIKKVDNRGKQQVFKWVKYTPCGCAPPMRNIEKLYAKRLEVGKKTPLGKAAKVTYNSAYGKFAQSIGDPKFGNPVYASLITAGCRTQIINAIGSHPQGINSVSMVATDAVYFTTPHPGLKCSNALGEWDYKERLNLTLFKPGVYWDDEARREVAEGRNPHFKARGISATDFASVLDGIDREFNGWGDRAPEISTVFGAVKGWPEVSIRTGFSLTTCLQALRRNDWSLAGRIEHGKEVVQSANPYEKRACIRVDALPDGRRVYRSTPHYNMDGNDWVRTHPYEKRFGMEDPWSDEYKERFGVTPEGSVMDIIGWVLAGK